MKCNYKSPKVLKTKVKCNEVLLGLYDTIQPSEYESVQKKCMNDEYTLGVADGVMFYKMCITISLNYALGLGEKRLGRFHDAYVEKAKKHILVPASKDKTIYDRGVEDGVNFCKSICHKVFRDMGYGNKRESKIRDIYLRIGNEDFANDPEIAMYRIEKEYIRLMGINKN